MAEKTAYCLFKGDPITGFTMVKASPDVQKLIRLPEASVRDNWVGVIHFPEGTTGEGLDYDSPDIALLITGYFTEGFTFIGPFLNINDAIAYADDYVPGAWDAIRINKKD